MDPALSGAGSGCIGGEPAMTMAIGRATEAATPQARRRGATQTAYPSWFYLPAAIIFGVLFLYPTVASLFFSLTRWTLFDFEFIGLDNFAQFFREPYLFK